MSKQLNEIKVLFISEISENIRKYLSEKLTDVDNINFIYPDDFSQHSLLKIVPKCDVLIGWRPNKEILEAATSLRVFINPGAGVKHLIELFKKITKTRDIKLINGHGNSYFVAQHAVALLLSLASKIVPHHMWMMEGKWRTGDNEAESIPIRFRQIGLLGYGAINQKVHKMLSGFNVKFSILKREWKDFENTSGEFKKYTNEQLSEFCREIDTLIIAVPHTKKTERMIGKKELSLIGEGKNAALIVNVARGEIIDEEALYDALKNHKIHGAAIDVWYKYKPEENENGRKYPFNYPFHKLDNIILSPHRGYSPFKDLLRWNEVVENLRKIAIGDPSLINIVNLENEY